MSVDTAGVCPIARDLDCCLRNVPSSWPGFRQGDNAEPNRAWAGGSEPQTGNRPGIADSGNDAAHRRNLLITEREAAHP